MSFAFSDRIFPCGSMPCVNNAPVTMNTTMNDVVCSNDEHDDEHDEHDVSLYHCQCSHGFSGKNCQGNESLQGY